MIEKEAELSAAVAEVGGLIQQINDHLAKHPEHQAIGCVRFPRGFLRTAGEIRRKLDFIEDETLRRNVS